MEKLWQKRKCDENLVKKLAIDLGVSNIISQLLILRGINTFDDAKSFFRPQISDLHDPYLMKNMDLAVNRIEKALSQKQKILIYGDYDVDGTTSVAMMYIFLKRFTNNIEYYIPCRYNEGYGVSLKGIDYAHDNQIPLIITLDCGIRASEQVNYANTKGIDFIICDHHTPATKLPNAIAILNPKQLDCNYPFKELSGCGVGFKLIQAYCNKNNIKFIEIIDLLDLLAISIGADIVDMTGENRVLSFYGLKQINSSPREGLKALINLTSYSNELSMTDIVFGIAPRINAAGRIEHASKAVEILVEVDSLRAKELANNIDSNNKSRKELDASITQEALKMVDKNKSSTVVFSKDWHKGVVGIVASRLIEKHYKPTIVFAENDGIFTGSARSVHNFDLYSAILKCSHLCEKFGGHKYAAGLSVRSENLVEFIAEFEKEVAATITNDQLTPKIDIDIDIDLLDVNPKLFRIIKQFAPFGPKNLSPIFLSTQISENGHSKRIGSNKSHLKLIAKTKESTLQAIGFGMGNQFDIVKKPNKFDICYSISENEWNGRKNLQLILKDIKKSVN